jgi:Exo-beta-D-glucosaminidase Ig-fold domain/Concanavalin A-like lectin/glucanases superfamily/Glycosyl hydrolases family 2/Glycosyl hydrolases family 2, sugar binding domain/Glycosyl hydrolases family 2, TIM barrel domain
MRSRAGWIVWVLALACCGLARPELLPAQDLVVTYGPFDGEFLAGGDGLAKELPGQTRTTSLPDAAAWSMYAWVQPQEISRDRSLIAGLGAAGKNGSRYLSTNDGQLMLWSGPSSQVISTQTLSPGDWHFVAVTSDSSGTRLYADGQEVARGAQVRGTPDAYVQLGPRKLGNAFPPNPWEHKPGEPKPTPADRITPFAGKVAGFTYTTRALSAKELAAALQNRPRFDLINFESGSPAWPVQVRQMYGQVTPQSPWTLPKSKQPFSKPVAQPLPKSAALTLAGTELWAVGGWRLAEAPKVAADGARLSQPGFDTASWYVATVPGTVLGTLIDRGVYPNPDYGLNNLAIPESLNKQDYWYRTELDAPAELGGKRLTLTFNGVNYASDVWLNGERLGGTKGAFIRGRFDVTGKLKPNARNAIAVRVSPPPHPGIPHEESLTAGVGENGGMQALDGPTFMASEGWDWIPSVRDRNTGLWQGVTLSASGAVKIGDPQVVTALPEADNSRADVEISVPVENTTQDPAQTEIHASFGAVVVSKAMLLAPGKSVVKLAPAEFSQLSVQNPRLWWPNGYGEPALYDLKLAVSVNGAESDRKQLRFGIRQVTYELSLMDRGGHLRRVEVDLTKARARNERIIDVRHEGIRKVVDGWAASLYPGAESSPAVRALQDTKLTPYLVIKVNGVRIAAKGGNWGTDDWRKRISREKLEPYFRLHRDAHLNIIRNWVGQNTEDTFYDLADEYGLMVLNDFWASTQDYQLEPQDVPLLLENAADVIQRYRNHPSIVLWFGRNEGVPQPVLNQGLDRLVAELDGTRWYTGSSNRVNLQNSGPYNYREPETYFTTHARGFSVEVGTPSFPTLESFKRWIPAPDLWPISDVWAYHDWHPSGNGDTKSFMIALDTQFGAATSLEDFERKAQMMNYVTHRAMFEGMNAHLWTATSGRLLWMTQPAWPSTMWQILSSDYDTHGSFYGVKKASEPVHVQMNSPDHGVVIINNTTTALPGVSVKAWVYSLDNRLVTERESKVDAGAVAVTPAFALDLTTALQGGVALVKLAAFDAGGKLLSENFYWPAREPAALRALNDLPRARVDASTESSRNGAETVVRVKLMNNAKAAALATKLTLMNADGTQILPAYFSDNYVSLLPGESRDIQVQFPSAAARGRTLLTLRGWNIEPRSVTVTSRTR